MNCYSEGLSFCSGDFVVHLSGNLKVHIKTSHCSYISSS